MAPRTRAASPVQPPNLSDSAELAHLALLAGDVIEALPTSLTRSLSDLKELDAVLSGSLGSITGKLNRLLNLLSDAKATPQARLELLKEVAEDASAFKLGGDDKIRVATGTCETIVQHTAQLDLITSLMTQMMPQHLLAELPASTCPSGYPRLFPSYAATGSNQTTTNIQYLNQRTHRDWFPPAQTHPTYPTGIYMGAAPPAYQHMQPLPSAASKASRDAYREAAGAVDRFRAEGRLMPVKPATRTTEKGSSVAGSRKVPAKKLTGNWQDAQQTYYNEPPNSATFMAPNSASKVPREMDQGPTFSRKHSNGSTPRKGRPPSSAYYTLPQDTEFDEGQMEHNIRPSPAPSLQSVAASASGEYGLQPGRKRPRVSVPLSGQKELSAAGLNAESPTSLEFNDDYMPSGKDGAKRKRTMKKGPDPSPDPSQSASPVTLTGGRSVSKTGAKRKSSQILANDESDLAPAYVTGAASRAARSLKADAEEMKSTLGSENERAYCYCNGPSQGEMIGCDNENCVREWFHLACTGLSEVPKGSWFCLDCKPMQGMAKKRK